MIELVIIVIVLMAVVGSLRKPRTFAEAEYAEHQRIKNRARGRATALVLLLMCGLIVLIAKFGSAIPHH